MISVLIGDPRIAAGRVICMLGGMNVISGEKMRRELDNKESALG